MKNGLREGSLLYWLTILVVEEKKIWNEFFRIRLSNLLPYYLNTLRNHLNFLAFPQAYLPA